MPDNGLNNMSPLCTQQSPTDAPAMAEDHESTIFRAIPIAHIRSNQNLHNTNNHPYEDLPPALQAHEGPLSPSDYRAQVLQTSYSQWQPILSQLQQPPSTKDQACYVRIPLPPKLCALLAPASEVGMQTGRVPEMLREDIEDVLMPLLKPQFDGKKSYFMRLDECSPKDGVGSMGPFVDAPAVLTSLLTSVRAYKALRHTEGGAGETMHLLPWRTDINTDNEFRLFVPPHGKVRAISQYSERLLDWADDGFARLKGLVPLILAAHEELRACAQRERVPLPPHGYVLDVHASWKEKE
ncbi:hypothetical protein FN846DRAFT_929367 [Sphaerosporella brunnea]|uniref:Uncharacterized protein n=1 Tax=Sphaerosporella brunnea TaxID=1250544 RepID=A0A5J5F986_9PEZI|nr:hypothetical protein FN846DRAFT_929367 [Sphaerosporella brunnea]